jgi:hypothetical protein
MLYPIFMDQEYWKPGTVSERSDSKSFRYLKTRIELDERRLRAVDPGADLPAVRAALAAFELACTTGPLAEFTIGERFRWLTATRSAMVPAPWALSPPSI